jgi:hypothetical protein
MKSLINRDGITAKQRACDIGFKSSCKEQAVRIESMLFNARLNKIKFSNNKNMLSKVIIAK